MWRLATVALLIILSKQYLVFSQNVTEMQRENCTDLNAERRLDNASCVVTCNKKALWQNPSFCFGKPILKEGCYCKYGYYLDQATNKCVPLERCSCNVTAHEVSKFDNDCGNNCETFHTLTECSKPLYNQCWCDDYYCKNGSGICILKEDFFG